MHVGLREANQHFSAVIRAVRRGEEVLITDRGRPLARVVPLRDQEDDEEAELRRMEAAGVLIRAKKSGVMPPFKPLKIRGKSISQTVRELRDLD